MRELCVRICLRVKVRIGWNRERPQTSTDLAISQSMRRTQACREIDSAVLFDLLSWRFIRYDATIHRGFAPLMPPHSQSKHGLLRRVFAVIAIAAVLALFASLFRNAYIDDTYITLV